MKFNKWTIGLLASVALCAASAVKAQTVSQVPNQLPPIVTPPAGANVAAFNTNGLDFTNVDYKVSTGSSFESSGGVLSFIQGDVDVFSLGSVDLGVGAEATLSGTGSGLHSAAPLGELIKNFNNFQFVAKAGPGFLIDNPQTFYGAQVLEINYNLTDITSGFLANNHVFTYVGANIEFEEGNFQSGGKFQKPFRVFTGFSF